MDIPRFNLRSNNSRLDDDDFDEGESRYRVEFGDDFAKLRA
jgi:hypothetical protein